MGLPKLNAGQIKEILRLKYDVHLTHEQIGLALNLSKGVVGKYVKRAEAIGLDWASMHSLAERDVEQRIQTRPARAPTHVIPDYIRIHQELQRKDATLLSLWNEYQHHHSDRETYGYTQFCAYYHLFVGRLRHSMRDIHHVGEKLFIDFANPVIALVGGGYAHLFVAVMGASRYAFVCATPGETVRDWIHSAVRALHYFGGATKTIVAGNPYAPGTVSRHNMLRENTEALAFARHYRTSILPAHAGQPHIKAAADSSLQVSARWLLRCLNCRRFDTVDDVDSALQPLLETLNQKPLRGLTGSRASAFAALDTPALSPLPPERFKLSPASTDACLVQPPELPELAENEDGLSLMKLSSDMQELVKRMFRDADGTRQMLQTVLEIVPAGITIAGGPPDFPIIANSKRGLEMIGRTLGETSGIPAGAHITAYGARLADGVTVPVEEQMPLYRATHYGELVRNEEWVIERPDHEKCTVLLNATPIRDDAGKIVGAISCWVDITARKQMEDAIQKTKASLARELEAMLRLHGLSNTLLSCIDLQCALEEVLDASIALLGAKMGNIQLYNPRTQALEIVAQRGLQREFLNHFHTVSASSGSACGQALRTGRRIVIGDVLSDPGFAPHRHIAAAAGFRSVQSTPFISRDGRLLGMLSTHFPEQGGPSEHDLHILDLYSQQAVDLLERISSEDTLRESELRFRVLAEASPAIIWQTDAEGNTVYVNPRYRDLLGKDKDLMGTEWINVLHPDDAPAYFAAWEQARRRRANFQKRVRLHYRDGSWRWFETYAMPWFSAQGHYAGHVGITVDVAEIVQAEETPGSNWR